MTHTTYRVRTDGITYQTTDALEAARESRLGAHVTACTSGRAELSRPS